MQLTTDLIDEVQWTARIAVSSVFIWRNSVAMRDTILWVATHHKREHMMRACVFKESI